jgi:tRNA-dihydrouridine synthase
MRRHYGNYLKGLPNIRDYRQKLVTVKTVEEIDAALDEIQKAYEGFAFERRKVDMEQMAHNCG